MRSEELKQLFDRQAAGYDQQWARMAPIRDALYLLLGSIFAPLPADARILCVGAGTGVEMAFLARTFPAWRFTAVEPSDAMLDVCRQRADGEGYIARCHFHQGYVDSLPADGLYDGATCFLVSQLILSEEARTDFFRAIAARLAPGALLASSDLASDVGSDGYAALLPVWLQVMSSAGVEPDMMARARAAYARDVAILPPTRIAALIESAGFELPIQFFQAGLMHGWFSRLALSEAT